MQGVGFRPHVYRIARKLKLTGWVQNNALGVLIEVQGLAAAIFLSELVIALPPLAKIDDIQSKAIALVEDETIFLIRASNSGVIRSIISPDTSICNDCLNELFEPRSRYYRYPFLNCTNCGPRFTITRNLPYDRCQTAMDEFPLCCACYKDYSLPTNRRYHAQPTACAACGPRLSTSIETISQALLEGKIVALKGMGGYQLLCNARNEDAVLKLRQRKNREAKPFALMVVNSESAESLVDVSIHAKKNLLSQSRPIVLLRKKENVLPQLIAPGLAFLGVMLPSTPLHYLIFNTLIGSPDGCDWLDNIQPQVLIATSANLAGNPLLINDEEAHKELSAIADLIVTYNRKIIARVDDSVIKLTNDKPMYVRRARGFSPESIRLPYAIPTTLALGGHLKNTFCITRGNEAFISQHIGSLTNKATIEFFHESLAHWIRFLDVKIERIACDLHPDFYTSWLANEYNIPVFPVQHHQAHLAAVAAEHHLLEPALGLALDGYGYGSDGQAWGGELCLLEKDSFKRLGHFYPIPQPGGDVASREPWRMAAAVLQLLGKNGEIAKRFSDKTHASLVATLLENNFKFPMTSSCGRWFDAASALLGVSSTSQYEGQVAMQLESLVTKPTILPKGWIIRQNQFNLLPLFNHLLDIAPIAGANLFHGTLIAGLTDWLLSQAKKTAIKIVLLSGGCFLNQVLAEGLSKRLMDCGLKVYFPLRLPPSDGGISLGQAWVAGNNSIRNALCV
ncbi:hydrogenase maturation protein HypF [Legionella brunensis]|uniref:Carbamoyltransferase HypF n=1 Tax=Legionella brunensis TaxID=29422 RepID=A0A0W0STF4_9GAMM|nr:hydrogenase maturation protein HypF [Legionella brunensis]